MLLTKWVDHIEEAVKRLGWEADLKDIYDKTYEVCRERNMKIPEKFEETVRGCIQRYCRDSRKFKGDERFIWVRRGRYRINNNADLSI